MTIDAVVYVSSVANYQKHPRKIECLESFAAGVKHRGGSVVVEYDYNYVPGRLAVMLGWATTNIGGRNIALRKQIIAEQQRHVALKVDIKNCGALLHAGRQNASRIAGSQCMEISTFDDAQCKMCPHPGTEHSGGPRMH